MTTSKVQIVLLSAILLSCHYSNKGQQRDNKINYDSLRIELEEMYDADQEIRRIFSSIQKTCIQRRSKSETMYYDGG